MAVQVKPEIALAVAFRVPAIFLDGKFGHEIVRAIEVKPVAERWVEKTCVVLEMVQVAHGQHARSGTGKDFLEQMMNLRELGFQLVKQCQVILAQRLVGVERLGHVLQRA